MLLHSRQRIGIQQILLQFDYISAETHQFVVSCASLLLHFRQACLHASVFIFHLVVLNLEVVVLVGDFLNLDAGFHVDSTL